MLNFAPLLASHPWLQGPMFTARMWVIASLVALVEMVVATVLGAWQYKEA